MKRRLLVFGLVLLATALINGQCFSGDGEAPLISVVPSEDSQIVAGEISPGMIVLPNGRLLTPEGNQFILTHKDEPDNFSYFPMNVKATPNGQFIVIVCSGRGKKQHLQVMNVPEFTLQSTFEHTKPEGFFVGLEIIPAPPYFSGGGGGDYPYLVLVSGGGSGDTEKGRIYVFGLDSSGNLADVGEIKTGMGEFVTSFALDQDDGDPDQAMLYVAYALSNKVGAVPFDFGVMDGATEYHTVSVVKYPYDLKLAPDGNTLYVTNWGIKAHHDLPKVSVIDVSDADSVTASPGMEVIREITVGLNPEGMAMTADGKKLYVTSSEEDNIAVINTSTNFVERFISLRESEKDPYGMKPTHAALNDDESLLLVSSSGRNSLDIIDIASGKYLGSIPVGWNPTAAVEVGAYWYVVNGKGEGGTANPQPYSSHVDCWETMAGSVSQIPVNTSAAYLNEKTMMTMSNNLRQLTYFKNANKKHLEKYPIKHIVYILKENKTYDQVMGDYPKGKIGGDLAYGDYCYTPNVHALADRFVNLDNFYADAEASITGHVWNASSNITDYVEKTYLDNYRTGNWPKYTGIEPTTFTKAGFILGHLKAAGITFYNYGEIVGTIDPETSRQFEGVVIDPRWPLTFNQRIPDKEKAEVFIEKLEAGDFPQFTFILFPNDHTEGCSTGAWHPDSLVADNDEATGRVVDAISHSPFWKNTLIFITQDDPQSGADHVDGHRTLGLVVSPWTKKGVTISTHYSWPNFFKTFEVFLGLPPMSTYDELATPMYDVFSDEPHMEPFNYIPQMVPMEKNGETNLLNECPHQAVVLSNQADFSAPDQAPELQEIFWMVRHPDKPFPKSKFGKDDDD
jgi:YVTN family beta-propeller protein